MNTLILSGHGTNCERETAHSCRLAGATAASIHVRHSSEIYAGGIALEDYGLLIFSGGFLDGDDLGAARACANRFRYRPLATGGSFLGQLEAFVDSGHLVLGICNGFQLLVKLGLLPGPAKTGQQLTLAPNANNRFEDRWVSLAHDPASPCVFTQGLEHIELPVRHGEGRLVAADESLWEVLAARHQVPLRYAAPGGTATETYPHNPNGSPGGAAAICNATGTVMGLMPHPEAFNDPTNHPRWTRERIACGEGLRLFRNAYHHLAQNLA